MTIQQQSNQEVISKSNWLTIKQAANANPAFSENSLRMLVFRADQNGLKNSVSRIGRKILINQESFEAWIASHQ
jgi:hypothetical protein